MRRGRRLVIVFAAATCAALLAMPAGAQPDVRQHEGYVCADLEGARAVAAELLNDPQGHDTVWDVVDAVRAEGHDCTHTLSGPMTVKIIATVEPIKGITDPPLHILEARAIKEKANVFIISTLE